ncbi:reverse transcriptase domain-containing protein [Tanacetum coccineum]
MSSASLNRFLSKSAEKSLPFFKTLKKCTKKSDFQWTAEAEAAFKEMKKLIVELPTLTAPMEKEELIVYLATTREAVSTVIMTEWEAKQMPVYFVSRALQGLEINYTSMEKLVLALVHASKRLKRHFQPHTIIVITDQPIKQILSRPEATGRLKKWSIKLGEYDIQYRPRTSIKGQILPDFVVEHLEDDPLDSPMQVEEELPDPWTLFTDGSSCVDGSGAGLILTNPEGAEFTYALRFRFDATNNEAEYEALIAGLRITEQIKTLLAEKEKARVVRRKSGRYTVINGHACWNKIRGSKAHTDMILLANDARGRKKIDKGMSRLPGSSPRAKKPAAKIDSHHVPIAILQMGNRHSRTISRETWKTQIPNSGNGLLYEMD